MLTLDKNSKKGVFLFLSIMLCFSLLISGCNNKSSDSDSENGDDVIENNDNGDSNETDDSSGDDSSSDADSSNGSSTGGTSDEDIEREMNNATPAEGQPTLDEIGDAMKNALGYIITMDQTFMSGSFEGGYEQRNIWTIYLQSEETTRTVIDSVDGNAEMITIGNKTYSKSDFTNGEWSMLEDSSEDADDDASSFVDQYNLVPAGEKDGFWYYIGSEELDEDFVVKDHTLKVELYVDKDTGLVEKLVFTNDDGEIFDTTISDYNSDFEIVAPI